MSYEIFIEKRAQKFLSKIDRQAQYRIIKVIRELSNNPYSIGAKKLRGREAWRVRIGNYRVIYEIFTKKLLVKVIHIGHRKDIYTKYLKK